MLHIFTVVCLQSIGMMWYVTVQMLTLVKPTLTLKIHFHSSSIWRDLCTTLEIDTRTLLMGPMGDKPGQRGSQFWALVSLQKRSDKTIRIWLLPNIASSCFTTLLGVPLHSWIYLQHFEITSPACLLFWPYLIDRGGCGDFTISLQIFYQLVTESMLLSTVSTNKLSMADHYSVTLVLFLKVDNGAVQPQPMC